MRLLYLDWPHLPLRLEAARAALPELVVIGGQPWEQASVLDHSPAAGRLGVRRGQPLGTAHRLAPEARFLPADGAAYSRQMEATLGALAAFTPSLEGEADYTSANFGRVLLGIEGLDRLWGDEPALAHRIQAATQPLLPGRPRMGIGNTRFGAQVAAVTGDGLGIIPAGDAASEAAFLAPLPISILPADESTRQRLAVFGLTTVGQLAALPRSAVVARLGSTGGVLHDLARGLDGRPLRPRRPPQLLRAEADIDPPTDGIEPLRFVLRHLCGALCAQLAARGAGCRQAILQLGLEQSAPLRYEQSLPEPAAAAELIERLLLARLLANPPQAAVDRLSLELHGTAPATGQQLGLFEPQLARAGRLDWQLAGLAIRFGPDRLLRGRIRDPQAVLAERRSEWVRATDQPLAPPNER
jgi:protein ImuB